MDRHTTPTRPVALPIALVVGCPPELLPGCRAAAARAGLVLKAVEFLSVTPLTTAWRPKVLFIFEDVFEFSPDRFTLLARSVGARLELLPESAASIQRVELGCRAALKKPRGISGLRLHRVTPAPAANDSIQPPPRSASR